MNERGDEIMKAFGMLVGTACDSEAAMELVEAWQQNLNDNYYPCNNMMLASLGEMYLDEAFTQNIDKYGKGTALFMSEAIRIYCERHPEA